MLTLGNELGALLERMGFYETDPLPQHFQVLLRVDMVDFDEQVMGVEYITHRFTTPADFVLPAGLTLVER